MGQSLTLPIAGLVTDPGPFSAAPPGSLSKAQNIAFRRPGVAEPRAKLVYTFDPMIDPVADDPRDVAIYRHFDGSTDAVYWFGYNLNTGASFVRRDAMATVTGATFPFQFTNCESAGGRLFATANDGVVTCDSNSDTTFRLAGMPQPASPEVFAFITGAGWLANDYATAYKAVYARTINERLILSAPSNVTVYRNHSGGAHTPIVTVYFPAELEEGDVVQIYRAYKVTPYTATPADEYRLRDAHVLTAADIVAGSYSLLDRLDDTDYSGPSLYTNAGQEGILLANTQPGYAQDVKQYNNMMFYAGQRTPTAVTLTAKKIGYVASDGGSFVSIRLPVASINAGNTITLSAPLTGYSLQAVRVGQVVTDDSSPPGVASTHFAANTRIVSIVGTTITLDQNTLAPGIVAFVDCWDWLEIDDFSGNVYTVYPNAVSPAGTPIAMSTWLPLTGPQVFGVVDEVGASPPTQYMGGAPDMERAFAQTYPTAPYTLTATPSGQGAYLGITITVAGKNGLLTPAFALRTSNPNAFDKYADMTTGLASDFGGAPGRIAWSKIDIPDAVPLPYYADVGDPSQPMLRIMPTQDCLFLFKTDGIFRLYGQTPDNLSIECVDPTARMYDTASQWVTRFGDSVFAITSRGVAELGNFGIRLVDQAIHQEFAAHAGNSFSSVTRPWALTSSQNRFIAFGAAQFNADPDDVLFNYAYVYWPDLGLWSTWQMSKTIQAAGSGFASEGMLGIPNGYANYVDAESEIRSAGLAPSYDDPQVTMGQGGPSVGNVISFPFFPDNYTPSFGDAFLLNGGDVYYVTSVAGFDVSLDRDPNTPDATPWIPKIAFTTWIEWIASAEGNIAQEKAWQNFTFAFDRLRGGTNLVENFTGYQNGPSAVGPVFGLFPVTYDPDMAAPLYEVFKPFIQRDHVPTDVARDWALKVGLQFFQAGAWFTTSGVALEYDYTGSRVGPATLG